MALELGVKLERVADEFTSSDFQIGKDLAGPLFLCRETDSLFILTAHLKGYTKRDIKIEISKDGTRIVISGEKAIQGTVMVGLKLYKKETEIRRFRKAFKIPEGVILDKIRGKFEEDKSILTISMPKKEKGVQGIIIEEVKEQELARAGSGTLQVAVNHEFPPEHTLEEGISREEESSFKEPKENLERLEQKETQRPIIDDVKEQAEKKDQPGIAARPEKVPEEHEHEIEMIEGTKYLADEVTKGSGDPSLTSTAKGMADDSHICTERMPQGEDRMHEKREGEEEKISQGIQGKREVVHDEHAPKNYQVHGRVQDVRQGEEKSSAVVKTPEGSQEHIPSSDNQENGRCSPCTIAAGSALLVSLVVFVIHFIRTKSQPGKRKD